MGTTGIVEHAHDDDDDGKEDDRHHHSEEDEVRSGEPDDKGGDQLKQSCTSRRGTGGSLDFFDGAHGCANAVPTRIHPAGGVVGHIGIQVVALRAGGVGLHASREEAAQRRIELTGPQVDEAGARIGQFT